MKRYGRVVIACMLSIAAVVWFVPGAAHAVENLVLTVLSALMGY